MPDTPTTWDWLRDKIMPVAALGIAAAGFGMYTKLTIIETKLDNYEIAAISREARISALEANQRIILEELARREVRIANLEKGQK